MASPSNADAFFRLRRRYRSAGMYDPSVRIYSTLQIIEDRRNRHRLQHSLRFCTAKFLCPVSDISARSETRLAQSLYEPPGKTNPAAAHPPQASKRLPSRAALMPDRCSVRNGHGGGIRDAGRDLTACQHGVRIEFAGDGDQRKYEYDGYGFHASTLGRQNGEIAPDSPREAWLFAVLGGGWRPAISDQGAAGPKIADYCGLDAAAKAA